MEIIWKTCETCGKYFRPTPNCKHIYCSIKCRNHNPKKTETTKRFQQSRRDFLNSYKLNAGCKICGYAEHPAALQFNHVHGVKKFNISADPKRKLDDIMAEIAKCEVLCANCHSVHTFENNHYITKRGKKNAR